MSFLREPSRRALRELRAEAHDLAIVEATLHPTRRDCLLWLRDPTCNSPYDPAFWAAYECGDYAMYLASGVWREFREAVRVRDHKRCAVCGSSRGLHVHHRTYRRVGFERNEDVITLCGRCHGVFHETS